jgi:hypothetical protein
MRPISRQMLQFLVLVFLFSRVPFALMTHIHHNAAKA